jgi:hypothetical protein
MAKELTLKQLNRMIAEAVLQVEEEIKDVEKAAKADEVDADEYADTLEKKKDHLAGVSPKVENVSRKALSLANRLREQREAMEEELALEEITKK